MIFAVPRVLAAVVVVAAADFQRVVQVRSWNPSALKESLLLERSWCATLAATAAAHGGGECRVSPSLSGRRRKPRVLPARREKAGVRLSPADPPNREAVSYFFAPPVTKSLPFFGDDHDGRDDLFLKAPRHDLLCRTFTPASSSFLKNVSVVQSRAVLHRFFAPLLHRGQSGR